MLLPSYNILSALSVMYFSAYVIGELFLVFKTLPDSDTVMADLNGISYGKGEKCNV